MFVIHPNQLQDLRLVVDRFGIYAQRKALQRAGIVSPIYRGDEWWHSKASDQWTGETARSFEYQTD
jgi:hypothetical protein